jgi:3-hydroxybutyryl-CoA dehydratase
LGKGIYSGEEKLGVMSAVPMGMDAGRDLLTNIFALQREFYDTMRRGQSRIAGDLAAYPAKMVGQYARILGNYVGNVRDVVVPLQPFEHVKRTDDSILVVIEREYPLLLANLTGDRNSMHLNEEFARTTHFKRPILHGIGLEPICAALLERFASEGKVARTVNYLGAIYPGDTIESRIKEIHAATDHYQVEVETTNHTQRGEGGLPKTMATHSYLIEKKRGERRQESNPLAHLVSRYNLPLEEPSLVVREMLNGQPITTKFSLPAAQFYGWKNVFTHLSSDLSYGVDGKTPLSQSTVMTEVLLSGYLSAVLARLEPIIIYVNNHISVERTIDPREEVTFTAQVSDQRKKVTKSGTLNLLWFDGRFDNQRGEEIGRFSAHVTQRPIQ